MGLGHESRAALLAVDDELDLIPVEVKAVQHRQITLARHPKRVRDSLGHKALHQQVASNFCCHVVCDG